MKVSIGKYRSWFGPYQLVDKLKYIGIPESIRDSIASKIPIGPFEWFDKKFKSRKIKIRIDNYDVWNMNHTLSMIIVPMLKKIKQDKQGAPCVDDKDCPENIRSTNSKPKENEWDTDDFHFDRWDYVLGEMIFAHEQIIDDDADMKFYDENLRLDKNELTKYNKRIDNGLRLFGKYYRNLWT